MVVFGLLATLSLLAYLVLLLSGFQPPKDAGVDRLFPEEIAAGEVLFLVLALLFTSSFTWLSWRSLVARGRARQLR
mgnify:CR=1 FL=1